MKLSEFIMNSPVSIEILDIVEGSEMDSVLEYFHEMDGLFNPFYKGSELTKINNGSLRLEDASHEVKKVLRLCLDTHNSTLGYFDSVIEKYNNPAGLLKGYMIWEASQKLQKKGFKNFYIGMGTDIDIRGHKNIQKWKVGFGDPPRPMFLSNCGISTVAPSSQTDIIYNPIKKRIPNELISVTVVAPNVFDSDRFSTACFAMGLARGMEFLERMPNTEGFFVTRDGTEISTSGFDKFLNPTSNY